MPTPSEIQTCVDNLDSSSQPIDFTILAAETSQANTGISFSVATVEDLPTYSDVGLGQIFFVESIGVPVISTRSGWSGLDGRVLSGDTGAQNALFTFGNNNCGQLGNGTVSSVVVPTREVCFGSNWCQTSAGYNHTIAIKSSGELWAWGCNQCGELGDGTKTTICSPVREFCSATNWCQVSAGNGRSAAIKTSGEIWVWGGNYVGDGTTSLRCSPVREFCSATDWCQVSASLLHTLAIKTDGTLWGWGANNCGRIADGTITNRCSPVREFCSATDWCQVSASYMGGSAVKTTGQLWVWGRGQCGQNGIGTTTTVCSPVREYCSATDWCQVSASARRFGPSHRIAIKTDGTLWGWGANAGAQLGIGNLLGTITVPSREFCSATDWCQAVAGTAHSAAVKTSGELWAWGSGFGALGDGVTAQRCSPVREICSATDWCQVGGGRYFTAAIRVIT